MQTSQEIKLQYQKNLQDALKWYQTDGYQMSEETKQYITIQINKLRWLMEIWGMIGRHYVK